MAILIQAQSSLSVEHYSSNLLDGRRLAEHLFRSFGSYVEILSVFLWLFIEPIYQIGSENTCKHSYLYFFLVRLVNLKVLAGTIDTLILSI